MKQTLVAIALLFACAAEAQIPAQAPEPFPVSRMPPVLPGSQTPPALPGSGMPRALPAQGTVQVAFTPWDNAEAMIVDCIRRASHQILVQAFSFTSRALANALVAARRRGVDVQVMADREQSFSGEASRIPDLVRAGIPVVLEVRYQSAHNKVMVMDAGSADAAVVTGSYNWKRHFADALPYAEQ
jgi:phosphatidylserine/phosphatidylglycerophosphate/cardiolipin synthase-like enzyme